MSTDTIKIRMYRHGFGDCFLLQFFAKNKRNFCMLIDCGLKLNDKGTGVTLENVRDDIAKTLKGTSGKKKPKLDVLVITHEHWDHVSAFHPSTGLFDGFDIDKVWMAWTENPEDDDAQTLNSGLVKRAKALQLVTAKIQKNTDSNSVSMLTQIRGKQLLQARNEFNQGLEAVLGFFGPLGVKAGGTITRSGIRVKENYAISLKTQEAMDCLRVLSSKQQSGIRYFDPGELVENMKGLAGIRIYIMGPPKGKLLNKAAPSKGANKEVYFGDSTLAGFVDAVLGTDGADNAFTDASKPFDKVISYPASVAGNEPYLASTYFDSAESYRKIDDDWLDMAGALAMQMDNDTNNTSLVLAIEFISSGKVLLFPGDAQVGNWLSWHDHQWEVSKNGHKTMVNATMLLNNTVFYKAGHHASHNATLKEKGLELMTSDDLVVFVPEKEKQYNGIPYKPLLTRLSQKTKGRMLVSADKNFPPEETMKNKPEGLSNTEWQAFKKNIKLNKVFIEYTLKA